MKIEITQNYAIERINQLEYLLIECGSGMPEEFYAERYIEYVELVEWLENEWASQPTEFDHE